MLDVPNPPVVAEGQSDVIPHRVGDEVHRVLTVPRLFQRGGCRVNTLLPEPGDIGVKSHIGVTRSVTDCVVGLRLADFII